MKQLSMLHLTQATKLQALGYRYLICLNDTSAHAAASGL
jgi:hypothetical protein